MNIIEATPKAARTRNTLSAQEDNLFETKLGTGFALKET